MWCAARAMGLRYCLVHCQVSLEAALQVCSAALAPIPPSCIPCPVCNAPERISVNMQLHGFIESQQSTALSLCNLKQRKVLDIIWHIVRVVVRPPPCLRRPMQPFLLQKATQRGPQQQFFNYCQVGDSVRN